MTVQGTDASRKVGGRYIIGERLGGGGMGVIYRAIDERSGAAVALKLLPDYLIDDADARARIAGEARAVAGLEHPHIVRLLEAGEEDGRPFLVMELVEGGSLKDRLRQGGPLPEPLAIRITSDIAEALQAAHERGIVHRDIKPQNVLLTVDDRAKLADFGIARILDEAGMTATGSTVGSLPYMAPEQLRGDPPGPASDLYALGALLFETLTGGPPFGTDPAQGMKRLDEPAPDVRLARPGVSECTASLVAALLARSAADRPGSAREVIEALRADAPPNDDETRVATRVLPTDHGPAARAYSERPTAAARGMRSASVAALVGLLLVGLIVGAAELRRSAAPPVPDVVGMSVDQAKATLQQAGLSGVPDGRIQSQTVARGAVAAQEPQAATNVRRGSTVVRLILSIGSGIVPSLANRRLEEAEGLIYKAGLVLATPRLRYSGTVPAGRIISQTPGAGTHLAAGQTVRLIVSAGPEPPPSPSPDEKEVDRPRRENGRDD